MRRLNGSSYGSLNWCEPPESRSLGEFGPEGSIFARDPQGANSEAHRRLVAAAVRYFAEVEDEDHDLHSAIGLDDDIRVLNEVAHVLGRDDLKVKIEER